MKLLQNIVNVLHLHKKWVRVMLSFSIFAIVALFFIPQQEHISRNQIVLMTQDTIPMQQDSVRLAITNVVTGFGDTIVLHRVDRRIASVANPISSDSGKAYSEPAPPPPPENSRVVAVVEEKKPFDWKGTITWGIGVLNGLVLVVLNIKNLIFKKNT